MKTETRKNGKVKRIREADFVQIFTTDLNGRLITLQLNPNGIESIMENGIGFDGSSVPGIGRVEDSDRLLMPIQNTYKLIKFKEEKIGFFIGEIYDEQGVRSCFDPRATLEKVLIEAQSEFGFRFLVGPEHEFFLLTSEEYNKKIHTDRVGYCNADPSDNGSYVRKSILKVLADCGIQFEKAHHEVTNSQHEINLPPLDPLKAADRTLFFNYITKKVAEEHGYHVTFMPKPFDGKNRSAFHIHLSVQNEAGRNLFYKEDADYGFSPTARQFIGGILKYARESSIIMASTFNSYKAYIIEREAPIKIGWGMKNRSSMVRIPQVNDPDKIRIELRSPDPSGNVYLQMAVLIGMGLQGIKENLDCGSPDNGSNYSKTNGSMLLDKNHLPKCMFEALVEAERSDFLRKLLGEELYSNYISLKIAEWEDYRIHVTAREYHNYLKA